MAKHLREANLIRSRILQGGRQHIYKFPNGYGASVVRNDFSYGSREGLWELAVLRFWEDEWDIDYTTKITSDVVGHLTEGQVNRLLRKIKRLK